MTSRSAGPDAEVAVGPDPEELQRAQRFDQVAARIRARERGRRRRDERIADDQRHRKHDDADCQQAGLAQREVEPARRHGSDYRREQKWRKPRGSPRAQPGEQRGDRDCDRQQRPPDEPPYDGRRYERRDQRDQRGSGHLLDPSPQRVTEQQRRLRAEESDGSAQRARPDERCDERVEGERQHRGDERQVGLEHPRDVDARQLPCNAERQEDPDRVAVAEVERERRLVGGGSETVEAAAVVHHPIREGEPRRGVVELDVAGKGCFTRERDGSRERGKHGDRARERPRVDRTIAPRARQRNAGDRACGDHGRCEVGSDIRRPWRSARSRRSSRRRPEGAAPRRAAPVKSARATGRTRARARPVRPGTRAMRPASSWGVREWTAGPRAPRAPYAATRGV